MDKREQGSGIQNEIKGLDPLPLAFSSDSFREYISYLINQVAVRYLKEFGGGFNFL